MVKRSTDSGNKSTNVKNKEQVPPSGLPVSSSVTGASATTAPPGGPSLSAASPQVPSAPAIPVLPRIVFQHPPPQLEATIEIQYKDSHGQWITSYPFNGNIYLPKGIVYTFLLRKFTCDYAMQFDITLDGVRTFTALLKKEVLAARFYGESQETSFLFDQIADEDMDPDEINDRIGRISVYYSFCKIKEEVKEEKKTTVIPVKIGSAPGPGATGSGNSSVTSINSVNGRGGCQARATTTTTTTTPTTSLINSNATMSSSSATNSSSSSTGLTAAMNAVNLSMTNTATTTLLGMTKDGGPSGHKIRRYTTEPIHPHQLRHWSAWLKLKTDKQKNK